LAADPLLGCTLFLGGAQFFFAPVFFVISRSVNPSRQSDSG